VRADGAVKSCPVYQRDTSSMWRLAPSAPGKARGAWDFQISATAFGVSQVIEYTFVL